MIPCETCEFFSRDAAGRPRLACDPFSTIKEPECLVKHQLVQLDTLSQYHKSMADMYRRLAPLQEKMMRHLEREIDEADAADQWKYEDADEPDDDEDDPFRI